MKNFQFAQISAPSLVWNFVQRCQGLRLSFVELGEVGVDEAYGLGADTNCIPCITIFGVCELAN